MSTTTTTGLIDALATQVEIIGHAIRRNIDSISGEESVQRPDRGGNCINWVLGHITVSRSRLLERFGGRGVLDAATIEKYKRGSSGEVAELIPFDEIVAAFDRSQPLFIACLQKFTDEELAAKSPFSSPAGPEATLGQALASMVFHEAYHSGQLGVLRRLLGKEGAIK